MVQNDEIMISSNPIDKHTQIFPECISSHYQMINAWNKVNKQALNVWPCNAQFRHPVIAPCNGVIGRRRQYLKTLFFK